MSDRLSGARLRIPMTARSTTEAHRAASQLELLFDLTFVIAIAAIASELAHTVASGRMPTDPSPFLQVFFAIWWAWMNFTWFASAYDTDDVVYRLLTMVQMAGVLVLAAGVPSAIAHDDYWGITLGYLIMRTGLVTLWLRAAIECASTRGTTVRYAIGITALEVMWLSRQALAAHGALPAWSLQPIFLGLVAAELCVPWWAERCGRSEPTSWHPHHIAERYGLFAILLLGEGVLAASSAVPAAMSGGAARGDMAMTAIASFGLVMSIWWLYFLRPAGDGLARRRDRSFWWGYVHYGVFAALAALGAGLEVAVEHTAGHVEASQTVVELAVVLPVAAFIVMLTAANAAFAPLRATTAVPSVVAVVLVVSLPLLGVLTSVASVVSVAAGVCVLLIVAIVASGPRAEATDCRRGEVCRGDR